MLLQIFFRNPFVSDSRSVIRSMELSMSKIQVSISYLSDELHFISFFFWIKVSDIVCINKNYIYGNRFLFFFFFFVVLKNKLDFIRMKNLKVGRVPTKHLPA